MKKSIPILLLLLSVLSTDARMWTETGGRTFDAEVVWVNAKKTVKLSPASRKMVTRPFSDFNEEDIQHLEYLLSRKGRGKLHAVPWEQMNQIFGAEIWQDDNLWDDPTDVAAERMNMQKESKTDFMENYRTYPLGEESLLSEPTYSVALYGGKKYVDSLSFVFLNLGDMPTPDQYPTDDELEEIAEQIEASGEHVHDAIAPILGKAKRDSIGRGNMREKVWRWNWNGHAVMLTTQEGRYAMLRIIPTDRADRAGRVEKITSSKLRKRMASCVERRDNGDVFINNIPMVNQGPKGYCSPATWERYLRYLEIPADMYQLALVGNTGIGGGTYAEEMIEATRQLLSHNGRELEKIDDEMDAETVAEYIDQGMPIMWHFLSTRSFQVAASRNTARRNGKEVKEPTEEKDDNSSQGGHICLIIGYNEKTGEIAISDSWGPRFAKRWVPLHLAAELSYGTLNVIKW